MIKKWSKGRARFIGRIIFADFLEYPLEKYKRFIENVEKSPFFDKHGLILRRIESTVIAGSEATKQSPSNVVAKIAKSDKGFSIKYTYEGFNIIYDICDHLFKICGNLCYKLRRINSRNELTHRILKGIIEHQKRYLKTSNPIDLVPLSQVQLPIDNSWTSRLVNRLSVITPSGEEKPLKWFFQTQKDINKRLIKQLLDKENEDIQSGKLKKPYTDNELKGLLETSLREKVNPRITNDELVRSLPERGRTTKHSLSRWSVGHCRKDMGIPPAKRRLSGYKYPPLSANFSMLYPLVLEEVLRCAPLSAGIYEFRLKGREIEYPNGKTQVIYIGSTKNIKKRLREHLGKNSKNGHIRGFLKKLSCSFRYIQFSKGWKEEEGRLYGLFVSTYGAPPKCNRVRPS